MNMKKIIAMTLLVVFAVNQTALAMAEADRKFFAEMIARKEKEEREKERDEREKRQEERDKQREEREKQAMAENASVNSEWSAFSKNYAIVLFISSTCPHCHRFAPIVRDFAANTGVKVYAYSIDGKGLPEYPLALSATPEVKTKFYKERSVVVPSVFLVNVNTMAERLVKTGEESKTDFYNDMRAAKQSIAEGNLL